MFHFLNGMVCNSYASPVSPFCIFWAGGGGGLAGCGGTGHFSLQFPGLQTQGHGSGAAVLKEPYLKRLHLDII